MDGVLASKSATLVIVASGMSPAVFVADSSRERPR
jgi:hypothetical protein